MKRILIAALLAMASRSSFSQVTNANYSVLDSALQTGTTVTTLDQVNKYYRGGQIIITVSAYTAGSYTPTIQGKNESTGLYYDVLVGPSIVAAGTTVLKVYPGVVASANTAASDLLPRTWRVLLTGASGQSMTLSIQANLGN